MSDADDIEELIARIVRKKFPALALLDVRTYRVIKVYTGANYGRCDLALESDPEQQLPRVDQWPGIPGGVGLPAVDSLVEVTWRGGENKSPVIVGFQPSRVTGGVPAEVKINAGTLIELGGASAVSLAKASPIATWADLVVSAITALGGTCAALSDPATTKVKGA